MEGYFSSKCISFPLSFCSFCTVLWEPNLAQWLGLPAFQHQGCCQHSEDSAIIIFVLASQPQGQMVVILIGRELLWQGKGHEPELARKDIGMLPYKTTVSRNFLQTRQQHMDHKSFQIHSAVWLRFEWRPMGLQAAFWGRVTSDPTYHLGNVTPFFHIM